MKFYAKNKRRYTYEYTNYVFEYIEQNISINSKLQLYLLNRISKSFSAFIHDFITELEYMNIVSNCFTLAIEQSQLDIAEQITVNE